jgi:hypothetical protein
LEELDDILIEQDIPPVEWIAKPIPATSKTAEPERPSTPTYSVTNSDAAKLASLRSGLLTPDTTPKAHGRAKSGDDVECIAETTLPMRSFGPFTKPQQTNKLARKIDRVISEVSRKGEYYILCDRCSKSWSCDGNASKQGCKIRAAGEAYVC